MLPSHLGRDLLVAIKNVAGLPGPQMALNVCGGALLRPVATCRAFQSHDDVRRLTEWRNRYSSSFLTEFTATESGTSSWLEVVVGQSDDRILFMLDNADGYTIGYMGLAFINWNKSYGEADAVVRGSDCTPGLMGAALQTMLRWALGQLGLHHLGIRVRSDNNKALSFYQRLGFVETRRVPLTATAAESGTVTWRESGDDHGSGIFLVHHVFANGVAKQR